MNLLSIYRSFLTVIFTGLSCSLLLIFILSSNDFQTSGNSNNSNFQGGHFSLRKENNIEHYTVDQCRWLLMEEGFEKPRRMMKRTFNESNPVRIYKNQDGQLPSDLPCSVYCFLHDSAVFEAKAGEKPDATFEKLAKRIRKSRNIFSIYRQMESVTNYPDGDFETCRTKYDIVMTPQLKTHVPIPYFSWVFYDLMKPAEEKQDPEYLSSAFISNCDAKSFRLEALKSFIDKGIATDYRGRCSVKQQNPVEIQPHEYEEYDEDYSVEEYQVNWNGEDYDHDPMSEEQEIEVKDGNKDEIIAKYKFNFAFENSQEEDYVTEKFFSALAAGTVPVVIGAPNIADFAPSDNSILVVNSMDDVEPVAKMMKALSLNETEYQKKLAWKQDGPSDRFKALVDLSVVHSSCRLCVHVADRIRKQEMCSLFKASEFDDSCNDDESQNPDELILKMPGQIYIDEGSQNQKQSQGSIERFCSCNAGNFNLHLLQVRERGRFEFEPIFLQSDQLTVDDLTREIINHFNRIKYKPIWTRERDQFGRQVTMKNKLKKQVELKIYKIYPVGASQRAALFGDAAIDKDFKLINFVKNRPCGLIEVIFV